MVGKPFSGVGIVVDVVVHAVAMPKVICPLPWRDHTDPPRESG